jgi:hypothetical protein
MPHGAGRDLKIAYRNDSARRQACFCLSVFPRKLPIVRNVDNVLQMALQRSLDSTSAPAAQARHERREVARPFRFRDTDDVLGHHVTMHR